MSKLISKIVVPDSTSGTGYSLYNVKDSDAVHSSDVGVASGVASLDSAGKVPSSQLPSYVDDVIEGYYHENKFYTTYTPGQEEEDPGTYSGEITAETGKIYVDISTNQSYRWSGSAYIVISSPYVLPTASANTLGGVKVGSNLSIDQNGVLSAAAAANEVQIGGETPSLSSDVEIFIDTTEDATAEVYTKQQQDGKFVVIKDLSTAPTESTITYTENGTVKNFKQGDEVRVPDQDADNGYTFYKLYELTTSGNTTTATWDKLGAGSSLNTNETVNISLTQVGGNSADLTGASITITDDDSGDTIYTATWAGIMITTEIPAGTYYTISVSSITGYLDCTDKSYLAGFQTERSINFKYMAPGTYVEATDGTLYTSSAWPSSGKTANSVVYLSESFNFKIALTNVRLPYHNNTTDTDWTTYMTSLNLTQALQDHNGADNTDNMILFNTAHGTNNTNYAAPYCKAFTFPNGESAYLPTLGQVNIIVNNRNAFNTCLQACNGTQLEDFYYYSSSCGEAGLWRQASWESANVTTDQNDSKRVVPCADYE